MLSKGAVVGAGLVALDHLLRRMARPQSQRTAQLRALHAWRRAAARGLGGRVRLGNPSAQRYIGGRVARGAAPERGTRPTGKAEPMTVLTTLLVLAMAATLGVLIVGLAGFFHGGEFNRKYGNKLMQARVALQAVAVLLLLIVLISAH
jgi:Hypoxia induced protein conserved region